MSFEQISAYYDLSAHAIAKKMNSKSGVLHFSLKGHNGKTSRKRRNFAAEELIAQNIESGNINRILELGCGFGYSLHYLSNIYPEAIFSGICASEAEILQARHLIRESGKIKSLQVFKGDFEDPQNYRVFTAPGLVFAIDSLRHLRNPQALLQTLAELLPAGGRLVIIDCFLPATNALPPKFLANHHMSNLSTAQSLTNLAAESGFSLSQETDLSDQIDIPLFKWGANLVLKPLFKLLKLPSAPALDLFTNLAMAFWQKKLSYKYLEFRVSQSK